MKPAVHGIYDALIDEFLSDTLARHPELRTLFGKIDLDEQPARYSSFVAKVLEQALLFVNLRAARKCQCERCCPERVGAAYG